MENVAIEIMNDINERITNIENQESLLTDEREKLIFGQQKLAFQESLKIVAKYLGK